MAIAYMDAVTKMVALNKKWGVFKDESFVDRLDKIMDGIRSEVRFALTAEGSRISRGLLREMRGELVLCGKLKKVLERGPK